MSTVMMDCPGCGQPNVPRRLVACRACWLSVPAAMRNEVWRTAPGTIGRVRAVGNVRNWLRWQK